MISGFQSEPIHHLIDQERLKPLQRLVEGGNFVGADPASLLHSASVLSVELFHDIADLATCCGELDTNATPISQSPLMIEEPKIDKFLEVVRHIRAKIEATAAQLAYR